MQVLPVYHSISTAPVWQKPGRLAASFQLSIRETDGQASVAHATRVELVVGVRALSNVTQPTWQQGQQTGKPRILASDTDALR